MRTGYIYSLVFALLTSGSIAAIAAPTVTSDPATPSLVQDVAQPK